MDVVCQLRVHVLDPVQPLTQGVEGAGSASWQAHSPQELIAEATQYYLERHRIEQGADALPPLWSRRARSVRQREGNDEASSAYATSVNRRMVGTRLVLV